MSRGKNLIGQRFGMLTVIEKAEEYQDRYFLWRCRCDCGGEILVNTKRLSRGTISNCGCVPKTTAQNGSIAEDLTGHVFGRLTVLHQTKGSSKRTHWLCLCSCGNETVVSSHELKAGKTKSCGCAQHLKGRSISDITQQRFGRLVALHPTEKRDKKASVYWHCRCDCGNELDVTQDGLVNGSYRSCGCLRKEIGENLTSRLHFSDGTCVEILEKRKQRRDKYQRVPWRISS